MIAIPLVIKICILAGVSFLLVAGIRKAKSKFANQKSADFSFIHTEILQTQNILSFVENIESNDSVGLVIYISPKDSNNSIVNHCRQEFQKKFGNKEGIALLELDNNKKIVMGKLYSFDAMEEKLNEIFEEWNLYNTDYRVIKK